MSDGETSAEPVPSPAVPPASRLGTILGWGLPALGVACLIASGWIGFSADAAWSAAQAHVDSAARAIQANPANSTAYAAYLAARAAFAEASLRAHLLAASGWLSLLTVPGLLYAARPSLLGGPVGRFLRTASAKWAPQHPQRKRPITFYQGLGLSLFGMGWATFRLEAIAIMLFPAVWWLISPIWLLVFAAIFMSFPLMGGSWWFTHGRR